MKFVVGIDSGGTSYRLTALSLDGRLLGSYVGDSCYHHYLTANAFVECIDKHFEKLCISINATKDECMAIFCGTTGLDCKEDEEFLYSKYRSLFKDIPIKIISDVELAYKTLLEGNGIVLISGTGSIAYGEYNGTKERVGGWPHEIFGDEGSGQWISRKILREVGRSFDLNKSSVLIDSVKHELKIKSVKDLFEIAYKTDEKPRIIPQLGFLADSAAFRGDETALKILEDGAFENFKTILELSHLMKIPETENIEIGLWGSTILKSKVMINKLQSLLISKFPNCKIKIPSKEAVVRASELALNLYWDKNNNYA